MRTLSRRFLNRRTAAAKTEVTAVEFWSGAAIGQSEIADDQVSACLRRETLAGRLCTMRGEKKLCCTSAQRLLVAAQGGRNRIEFSSRSVIRQRRLLQFASLLRRRCPFKVGYPAPIRLSMAHRPKRLTNSGICDAGCEPTCVRDRAYGVVAGSLIASRSQFADAACKTPHFEILELVFCKTSSEINLFLTGSHSRGSLQNKRWAKLPQSAPPNLQIRF